MGREGGRSIAGAKKLRISRDALMEVGRGEERVEVLSRVLEKQWLGMFGSKGRKS